MRRPPPRPHPGIAREATTRALARVLELVLLVVLAGVAAWVAFTWAVGPEVREVLDWLLGLVRSGVGLASDAYRWVLEQLRRLG